MRDLQFVQEEWLPCPGFDNYQISTLGNVKGVVRNIILSQKNNKKGYPEVKLWKNNKSEARNPHRLVALSFIPNPDNLSQVNHKDGNKLNNRIDNLEWVSNSVNQLHAYKLGLQPSRAGENNSKTNLTDKKVTEIKLYYNSGKTPLEVSEKFNVSLDIVRNIIYLRTWKTNKTPILKRDDRSKTKKPVLCEN